MQCYTILYTGTGYFLTFVKRTTAYFYHNADGQGGTLYEQGLPITNGPGLFAFPGGRLDQGETPTEGCLREFTEECGSKISFSYNAAGTQVESIIFNDANNQQVAEEYDILHSQINGTADYQALYLQVSDEDLNQIEMVIMDTNLEENSNAAAEVSDGNFGTYDAIFNTYPFCPLDNELSEANVWQVQQDINQIQALNANVQTDWYYAMIVDLANGILNMNINY